MARRPTGRSHARSRRSQASWRLPKPTARANHMGLMIIGATFLIGRVAHVIGLYTPSEPGKAPLGRQVGVLATFGALLVLGLWTLWVLATVNL